MRSKARVLTTRVLTVSIVCWVAAALLSLTVVSGQPVVVAGPLLGVTPTPTSAPTTETPSPTPEATPAPAPPSPSSPHLVLTKTTSKTEVFPGASVEFTIRVCNVGDATADNVVVSDALPSELEVVSASVSQGVVVVVGNGVRAEFGALVPGACATLTIVARVRDDVPPGTQISNVATTLDQVSNEVTVTVVGFLPASGGTILAVVAGLLAVGVGLLAAGLVLRVRGRVLRDLSSD